MANNQASEALIAELSKTTGLKLQEKRVKKLLDKGANPNYVDAEGRRSMTYAGRIPVGVLNVLIEAGADPNATDNIGFSALMMAIGRSRVDNVVALLQAGANPNFQTNQIRRTALMMAVEGRPNEEQLVQILIDAGADLNLQDYRGNTAIMLTPKNEYLNYFTMLYLAGADLTIANNNGQTIHDLATAEMRKFMRNYPIKKQHGERIEIVRGITDTNNNAYQLRQVPEDVARRIVNMVSGPYAGKKGKDPFDTVPTTYKKIMGQRQTRRSSSSHRKSSHPPNDGSGMNGGRRRTRRYY
jgi:hypothetical protein